MRSKLSVLTYSNEKRCKITEDSIGLNQTWSLLLNKQACLISYVSAIRRRDEEYSSYEINAPFPGDTGVEIVEYLPEQRRQTKTPNVIEAHLGVLLGQSAQI